MGSLRPPGQRPLNFNQLSDTRWLDAPPDAPARRRHICKIASQASHAAASERSGSWCDAQPCTIRHMHTLPPHPDAARGALPAWHVLTGTAHFRKHGPDRSWRPHPATVRQPGLNPEES
jgi:hypothetical protein